MSGFEVVAVIGIVAVICSMYQDGHVLLSRLEKQHLESREIAAAAEGVESSDALIAHLKASLKRGEEMIRSQFDKDHESLGQAYASGDRIATESLKDIIIGFQSKLLSTFQDSLRKDTPFDPSTLQDISDRSQEEAMAALMQLKQRIITAQARTSDDLDHGFTTTFGVDRDIRHRVKDQYIALHAENASKWASPARIPRSGDATQYPLAGSNDNIPSVSVQDFRIDQEQTANQTSTAKADHIVEIPIVQAVSSVAKISKPSLGQLWEWYISTGSGFLIFLASLTTALVMIVVGKTNVSTAFTVASWILGGGTLLSVTVKAFFWERPENTSGMQLQIMP
ncbi:hypothetical protein MMC11_001498 [Xylographa trunciseda]|nr:hypothetical protein [Xylographa trunciseda]